MTGHAGVRFSDTKRGIAVMTDATIFSLFKGLHGVVSGGKGGALFFLKRVIMAGVAFKTKINHMIDQDINVSEKPMHSVIEEMIESSNGNGKYVEEKQQATVPDAEEAEPSVTTAAVDDGLDAIDTDHSVEENAVEQEKEQPEPVDYQTAEAQLQDELREAKRQAIQEKAPEVKIKKSMRVDADKIDYLMNQVGELVVSRAYFAQLFNEMKGLQQGLQEKHGLTKRELQPINEFAFRLGEAGGHLGRVSNELQEGVMKVRMLPIAQLFKRYPRLVRDLIHKTDKKVSLETRGEETELDKMVIEEISDRSRITISGLISIRAARPSPPLCSSATSKSRNFRR